MQWGVNVSQGAQLLSVCGDDGATTILRLGDGLAPLQPYGGEREGEERGRGGRREAGGEERGRKGRGEERERRSGEDRREGISICGDGGATTILRLDDGLAAL